MARDTHEPRSARPAPGGRNWVVAAVLLSAAVSTALLLLPSGTSITVSEDGTAQTTRETLLENQGWTVIPVFVAPVLISAAPWLAPVRLRRGATVVSAIVLTAGVALAIASVGLFYLPSVVLLVVAAIRARGGHDLVREQGTAT